MQGYSWSSLAGGGGDMYRERAQTRVALSASPNLHGRENRFDDGKVPRVRSSNTNLFLQDLASDHLKQPPQNSSPAWRDDYHQHENEQVTPPVTLHHQQHPIVYPAVATQLPDVALPQVNSCQASPYGSLQQRGSHFDMRSTEPKGLLPLFSGKQEFKVYFLIFDRMVKSCQWSDDKALDKLVKSLRDTALEYFSELPPATQISYSATLAALNGRFNDSQLSSTH